jgi:hypothetical protein
MRIQNDGIANLAASQAAQVQNATQPGGSQQTDSAAQSGSDQIAISSLSGNIASSSAALAGEQAARVSQLAAVYARGEYQPNSMQTSQALVAAALAGGSLEENG